MSVLMLILLLVVALVHIASSPIPELRGRGSVTDPHGGDSGLEITVEVILLIDANSGTAARTDNPKLEACSYAAARCVYCVASPGPCPGALLCLVLEVLGLN